VLNLELTTWCNILVIGNGRKITMYKYMHICAPFSSLRFRRLGSVVGAVRQIFLHSDLESYVVDALFRLSLL
jgi:hypothetical protein